MPFPHPSLLPGLHFNPNFFYLFPGRGTRGQGMGVVGGSSHVGLLLLPSSLPLLHHVVPPSADSSPLTSPVWVLTTGCSPSGTGCSSVGPLRGHKFCQQTCSSVGSSLSMGPQVLPGGCSKCGLPIRSQSPLGIHLLQLGFFCGLQVDICCTMDLHGLQEDSLPHHGLLHRLQGNLCSGTWSTFLPLLR